MAVMLPPNKVGTIFYVNNLRQIIFGYGCRRVTHNAIGMVSSCYFNTGRQGQEAGRVLILGVFSGEEGCTEFLHMEVVGLRRLYKVIVGIHTKVGGLCK